MESPVWKFTPASAKIPDVPGCSHLAAKRHLGVDPWLRSDVLTEEISLAEMWAPPSDRHGQNDEFRTSLWWFPPQIHLQSWSKWWVRPADFQGFPAVPWSLRSWWPRACTTPGWRRARTSWEELRASVPRGGAANGMLRGRFQRQGSQVFLMVFVVVNR